MHIKIDTGSSSTLTTDQLQIGMVVLNEDRNLYAVGKDSRGKVTIIAFNEGTLKVWSAWELENDTWTPVSDYTITISSKE